MERYLYREWLGLSLVTKDLLHTINNICFNIAFDFMVMVVYAIFISTVKFFEVLVCSCVVA